METRKRTRKADDVSGKERNFDEAKLANSSTNALNSTSSYSIRILSVMLVFSAALLISSILFSPINPEPYSLPPAPDLNPNQHLASAERILENRIEGPETIVQFKDSLIFGLANSTVIKLNTTNGLIEHLQLLGKENCDIIEREQDCGRPLGMRVHNNNLYVMDAYLGIFRYNLENIAAPAKNIVDKMTFGNDLAIASDGTIYYTCSSRRWQRKFFTMLVLEQIADGYLAARYTNGTTTILNDEISFANGVELSTDESYLLVAVTNRAQILKHWLKGSKAGKTELLTYLPGLPDNISINPRGNFWIGIGAVRTNNSIIDFFSDKPSVLRAITASVLTIFPCLREKITVRYGLVLELDGKTGKVVRELHDPTGSAVPGVSQILESKDGTLYLGSYNLPYITVVKP